MDCPPAPLPLAPAQAPFAPAPPQLDVPPFAQAPFAPAPPQLDVPPFAHFQAPLAPELQAPVPPAPPAPLGSARCPTVGSAKHFCGGCKPCAFFHTKGCESGINCEFCHVCGPNEKKKRQR